MQQGNVWIYEAGSGSGPHFKQVHTATREMVEGDLRAMRVRIDAPDPATVFYSERPEGWFETRDARSGLTRELWSAGKRLLLRCPLGVLLEWEYSEWAPQTLVARSIRLESGKTYSMTGTGGSPGAITHKFKIESFAEPVRVAAGEFEALRVRETMTWDDGSPGSTMVRWYAPGVGLVKELCTDGGDYERELVRFLPHGEEPAFDREALLAKRLPGVAPSAVTWLDQEDLRTRFLARFARVAGEKTLFRVSAQGARPFDPASPEHWREACRGEPFTFRLGAADGPVVESLARCAALLVAASRGAHAELEPLIGGACSRAWHDIPVSTGEAAARSDTGRWIARISINRGVVCEVEVVKRQ
jgi:hypothetical protein